MLLRRLYEDMLAQASYIIACDETRHAIVFDPNRDVDKFLAVAKADKLKITHVTETHIHADFVSGARALAEATGAKLLLSGEGGEDWQYKYAADADARILHDRDVIDVGTVRVAVLHTPGHTPEHLCFLHRHCLGEHADGIALGGLHLRRRRGAAGSSRARSRDRRHDGGDGASAVPIAETIGHPSRPPPDLARPWRRIGVRQGAGRRPLLNT